MNRDVADYINAAPDARQLMLNTLRDLIVTTYPDAEESMQYKMPTYSNGTGWVAIANQKNYVSLYTCAEQHLAEFKQRFPKIKTGKGCINFKESDLLDKFAITQVIQSAMKGINK